MKKFPLVLSTLFLLLTATSHAQIPRNLSYQGVLTDTLGNPRPDGSYTFTFRLYQSSAGGSAIWTEQKTLQARRGLFYTVFGDQVLFSDTVRFDRPYWLGVQVAAEPELSPRIALTAAGYSFASMRSDTARIAGTIPDNAVTSAKIADGAVTASKIPSAQVVKNLNGLHDGVTVAGQGGAIVTVSGDTIYINAGAGGGGPYLPLAGGTMTGAITSTGDPPITMGKGNFGSGNNNVGLNAFVAGENNIASGNNAAVGGGLGNTANGFTATVSGGYSNGAINDIATVSGGSGNSASGYAATVGGGSSNRSSGFAATVGGGLYNRARGAFSIVSGGGGTAIADSNSAIGDWSGVGGGEENVATGAHSTVAGGFQNRASGSNAMVGGGDANVASGMNATVGGGGSNKARGSFSFVGGGGGFSSADSNSALGDYTSIGGGKRNIAGQIYSTIAGGFGNIVSSDFATIGGGGSNVAGGTNSTVGGGSGNSANGFMATVAGGQSNLAAYRSFVGGGVNNIASAVAATVSGGGYNRARGDFSVVGGGGNDNSAADSNSALGAWSVVPGGARNVASGKYSFAAGWRAKSNHTSAFVWADSTGTAGTDFASTGANQFLVRASGGVGIGTNSPGAMLHVAGQVKITGGAPAAGRVLTSDATGLASWSDLPGGLSGSGTATRIAFWSGTSSLSSNANLFWDNTNSRLGIGTATPNSKLHVGGAIATTVTTFSIDVTLNQFHSIALVDATGASRTITLPTAAGIEGRQYVIKKIDGSNFSVTVDGSGAETIDGTSNYVLPLPNRYVVVVSDGIGWRVIGNN